MIQRTGINPRRQNFESISGMRRKGDKDKIGLSKIDFIQNGIPFGEGSVAKRLGTKLVAEFTKGTTAGISMLTPYLKADGSKELVVGYGSVLSSYSIDDDTLDETIGSGFSNTTDMGGLQYQDYVFYSNGSEGKLRYYNGTSTAQITDAVKGRIIAEVDNRLWLGGDDDSPYTCQISKDSIDLSSTPFFSGSGDWTAGTLASQGSSITVGSLGKITGITNINNIGVIIFERGIKSYHFEKLEVDTNLVKTLKADYVNVGTGNISFGGVFDGGNGIYFVNENGLNAIAGYENKQVRTGKMSDELKNYAKDLRFDKSKGVFYENKDLILIACRDKDISYNNKVLAYNTIERAWSVITGWYVSAWAKVDDDLYYGDSLERKIYKCFTGLDDNENDIEFKLRTGFVNNGDPFYDKVLKQILLDTRGKTSFTMNLYTNNDFSTIKASKTFSFDNKTNSRSILGVSGTGILAYGGYDYEVDIQRRIFNFVNSIGYYNSIAIEILEVSKEPFIFTRAEIQHTTTQIKTTR